MESFEESVTSVTISKAIVGSIDCPAKARIVSAPFFQMLLSVIIIIIIIVIVIIIVIMIIIIVIVIIIFIVIININIDCLEKAGIVSSPFQRKR